ncbi:MAG TPA: DUF3592 domain-containing protein [Candidatus Sulfomarinibacteraceae bacterium]|nr:DUF3592 domain-containing protein [Candidatus Sulfomarinibacteraceae bacterium]
MNGVETPDGASSRGGCRAIGGRIAATLFFLVFFLMGSLFVAVIVGDAVRQAAVWRWPEVECTILDSGVEETGDDESPYRPRVLFEYRVDGRTYRSGAVSRGADATSSYDKARAPADRYLPGSRATARVNPDLPGDAVLERRLPWTILVVFFPLIFVAVGAGGLIMVWRREPQRPDGPAREGGSISQRARGTAVLGRRIELGVGLLFAAVGGVLTVILLVIPAVRLVLALGWDEVPATVVASTVRSWSTDDGTSTEADVVYEYSAGGRSWRSNRRSFFPLAASGAEGDRALVERHPPGSSTTCFVDPGRPGRSVLDRSFRPEYLIGLFPLLFLGAGLGLTAHALRARRPAVPEPALEPNRRPEDTAERTLEPAAGPVAKIVAMILIAAFWNGIVGVFVWQLVLSFRRGHPDWFLAVFLIPFVLVGLGLILGIVSTTLAAFNPRPRLTIAPGSPHLGERLRVDWSFSGRTNRIRRLTIALEGHEKATYRRGTDTHTDRDVFAVFELVDTAFDVEIGHGTASVTLPEDTMHSFSSDNNAVVWSLVVHGEIDRWPDVSESYEVEVRPLPKARLLP